MSDPGDRKPLGKILLQQRLVSPAELDQLLERQRKGPTARLASTVAESGKVSEVELLRALSDQLGVPAIDLTQVVIPSTNLALVPPEVAKQYLILPFSIQDDAILLAMADPRDQRVVDEIEFVTGRTVAPYVGLHEQLTRVIAAAYDGQARGEVYYIGPNAPREYLVQLGLAPAAPPRSPSAKPPSPPAKSIPADDFSDVLADDDGPPVSKRSGTRHEAPPASGLGSLDLAFEPARGPTAGAPPPKPAAKTILVVDDEDDIRRLLRRVLTEKGYHVVEAARGTEALQAIRDHSFDCILLDAMLPEIHGFELCKRIKQSPRYGHIPIIMVSAVYRGWRFAEDLRESYGVTDFLEKPFRIADVTATVQRALEGLPEVPAELDEVTSPEARAALDRGIESFRQGALERAVHELKHAVSIEPGAFRLHYHLGLLQGRCESLFEAIHSLETALAISPRSFAALKNLAVLYQKAGFKHKAVESWERALRVAPDEETKRGIKEHLVNLL